jgi:fructosamine-3-kinase
MSDWHDLKEALRSRGIGIDRDAKPRAIGGGDISAAWKIATDSGAVFLKTGPIEFLEMFSAEAEGLEELRLVGAIRVPAVFGFGQSGSDAYLALEWMETGRKGRAQEALLGKQLALQHRHLNERFGWHRDNMIGTIPQLNERADDWIRFFSRASPAGAVAVGRKQRFRRRVTAGRCAACKKRRATFRPLQA